MSTAQAAQQQPTSQNSSTQQPPSAANAMRGYIKTTDVDKMDAAALAAAMQSGRELSALGRGLAKVRGLLPR